MAGVDFMIWNAAPLESESDESAFFERLARGLQCAPQADDAGHQPVGIYSPLNLQPQPLPHRKWTPLPPSANLPGAVPFCKDDPMVFIG